MKGVSRSGCGGAMGSSIGCGSVLEFQALSRICDFSDFRHGVSSGLLSKWK